MQDERSQTQPSSTSAHSVTNELVPDCDPHVMLNQLLTEDKPEAALAVASPAFEGSRLIMMLPAKPVRAPTQSPTGTASPAIVQRIGVNMMDALMRKAPLAIVVKVKP